MRGTVVPAFLLTLSCSLAGAQESQEPEKPFDPSTLRLTPPSSRLPLLGTFHYESPFDGTRRRLVILEPEGSFWAFEGRAPEGGEALLKLDPVGGLGAYRGEVKPGFDPCLPPGARVESVLVYPRSLSVEVAVGFVPPHERGRREGCADAITYVLLARAGGAAVRLAPSSEIRPRTRLFDASQEYVDRLTGLDQGSDIAGPDLTAGDETSFSLDAPKVPPGSEVRVIQVIEDMSGITWNRVELLRLEQAAEETERGEPDQPGQAKTRDRSRSSPSGWVRAEQVLGRLSYTLERE
jgi:hypothetical protein